MRSMATFHWLGISGLVAVAAITGETGKAGAQNMSVSTDFPCSMRAPYLKGTRLYSELCHRQRMISGETHKPGIDCIVHVQMEDYAEVASAAKMFTNFPCSLVQKKRHVMQESMYKMFNNQLSLDANMVPHAIAYPGTQDQISALVRLGGHLRRKVYVVGAGHGAEAFAHGRGIVISMLNRRSMDVIPDAKNMGYDGPALHMQCGVVWAETYAMAHSAKAFMTGGSCGTVGACGFFMGGGFGYLSGQLGFAADNVLRMNVVTATGGKLAIDADHHADLFNAIRGGGHAGLAIVSDVYYKLHPRKRFGCIFKINLVYHKSPEEDSKDPSWAMKLAEAGDGRQLNVKLRWQCDEANRHPFKFKVTLILLADPHIDTREGSAKYLKELLEKVNAPFPEGEMCKDGDWMRCLLGTKEKPTGFANCDTDDPNMGLHFSDETGELLDPNSDGGYDDQWGTTSRWHSLASNKKAPSDESLYSAGYKHRTTLKSLLVKELNREVLAAGRKVICDKGAGSNYIAAVWWGNGHWAIPGKGSVADVHKPFKYLIIISSDYHNGDKDIGNIAWSTRAVQQMASAISPQPLLFYPNLYDRLYFQKEGLPPFNQTISIEYAPKYTYGKKADMVMAAKKRWDPNNLFDVRFRSDRNIPGHLIKGMQAKYEVPAQIMARGWAPGSAVLVSAAGMAMLLAATVASRFRYIVASKQQPTYQGLPNGDTGLTE